MLSVHSSSPPHSRAVIINNESGRLSVGERVEVRRRYDGAYTTGFAVAGVESGRVLVRRCSDDTVVPTSFAFDAVRSSGGGA